MACELLQMESILHELHHDLQSFYWVILWVVLRHTDHSLGQQRCTTIFKYGCDQEAWNGKFAWLGVAMKKEPASHTLIFKDNEPLTTLMSALRTMVRRSVHGIERLTYDGMLAAFNEALAKDTWPADDRVECTLADQVIDSVVSPFQFAPDHRAPHVVSAPPASREEVILRAFRDSVAQGKKEHGAATVEEVEQAIKKRKERGGSLEQVEELEKALRDAKRRKVPLPRKGTR